MTSFSSLRTSWESCLKSHRPLSATSAAFWDPYWLCPITSSQQKFIFVPRVRSQSAQGRASVCSVTPKGGFCSRGWSPQGSTRGCCLGGLWWVVLCSGCVCGAELSISLVHRQNFSSHLFWLTGSVSSTEISVYAFTTRVRGCSDVTAKWLIINERKTPLSRASPFKWSRFVW